MDKQMRRDKLCLSFAIFIFSVSLLSSWAFAQCDDCDDNDPCTKDLCEDTTCQHIPQSCDNANSATGVSLGSGANSTPKSVEIPVQKPQAPSVTNEAVNIPANCDDNFDGIPMAIIIRMTKHRDLLLFLMIIFFEVKLTNKWLNFK